jgi:hypothetical protein
MGLQWVGLKNPFWEFWGSGRFCRGEAFHVNGGSGVVCFCQGVRKGEERAKMRGVCEGSLVGPKPIWGYQSVTCYRGGRQSTGISD